ncbi:L-2-hydroxyglutarate oxidase [Paradevosia shaoguanensis]|uniref:L-2-hydroxyglutarate oxidase n=1 Tax=Paradevosia shaoguanensis TaxID=1335043 RepID=A0AA41UAY8_9HYPH|nr:L-2-hydroxyglutarate oxidase [Paradevosia shaoguanensis]MCI0126820.1 L-2-hydroxyglutarate oxidase [Paradevosia shaoguanensis]
MLYDYCVIGGGIVGLAVARQLLETHRGAGILVLEKEDGPGRHQTGHNSGVIHAGVYYKPGSLKAELCRAGAKATKAYCTEKGIAFETRGKLIVASTAQEEIAMKALHANARANGIEIETLDGAELREREPAIRGVAALLVPETGIVDYKAVCNAMADDIRRLGGTIYFGTTADRVEESQGEVTVTGRGVSFRARYLVACAGLQSDRLARRAGLEVAHRIVPFRGEYYDVAQGKRGLVHHLIYPVPDPALPFLGIHLTPTIDGRLTLGPNAVLGRAREGYRRTAVSARDVADYAAFPGFWKLATENWRSGLSEFGNSIFKRRYLEACRKYCPDLELEDLVPVEAGIRAQAVMRDGSMVHDFLFVESPRMLHVCNAPSPAATSAIPIAHMIVERLGERA